MASDDRQDGRAVHREVRALQEREIAARHRFVVAEHALVAEACVVGRVFADAGIVFDPLTFVALRVLEGSVDAADDPVEVLEAREVQALVARSVERARVLLDDAA
jgi:hypothetical protein